MWNKSEDSNSRHIHLNTMVPLSPYIITFCSGKSGVGKSIIAANIASLLSDRGVEILLCDAHHTSPAVDKLFGIDPVYYWQDIVVNRIDLQRITVQQRPHLKLVAGSPSSELQLSTEQFKSSLQTIISEIKAECIIFDCNSGVSSEIIECCSISTIIFVVLTDEPGAVIDAYGLIKIIRARVPLSQIYLIINNVIDLEDADDTTTKLNRATTHFLDSEYTSMGFIPYDREVRSSIIHQHVLCDYSPMSPAAQALEAMASQIKDTLDAVKPVIATSY